MYSKQEMAKKIATKMFTIDLYAWHAKDMVILSEVPRFDRDEVTKMVVEELSRMRGELFQMKSTEI